MLSSGSSNFNTLPLCVLYHKELVSLWICSSSPTLEFSSLARNTVPTQSIARINSIGSQPSNHSSTCRTNRKTMRRKAFQQQRHILMNRANTRRQWSISLHRHRRLYHSQSRVQLFRLERITRRCLCCVKDFC